MMARGRPVEMNICMPLALAASSASMVETGIWWVLKLTSVPSMSKNRALIIYVSFKLVGKFTQKQRYFVLLRIILYTVVKLGNSIKIA